MRIKYLKIDSIMTQGWDRVSFVQHCLALHSYFEVKLLGIRIKYVFFKVQ